MMQHIFKHCSFKMRQSSNKMQPVVELESRAALGLLSLTPSQFRAAPRAATPLPPSGTTAGWEGWPELAYFSSCTQ